MTLAEAREVVRRAAADATAVRPIREVLRIQAALHLLRTAPDELTLGSMLRLVAADVHTPLRIASAHGLAGLSDPRAIAAIDAGCFDADPSLRSICVRASSRREPITAWARFSAPIRAVRSGTPTRGEQEVVASLLDACLDLPRARDAGPPSEPLVVEPRWIDLAAELRQDAVIGYSARRLLDGLPLAVAVAAIDRFPRRSVVAVVGLAVGGVRRDWVSRYRSGEHGVWAEVREHADAIAADPGLRAEAAGSARPRNGGQGGPRRSGRGACVHPRRT